MIKTSKPAAAGPESFITEESITRNKKKTKRNIHDYNVTEIWSPGLNVFHAAKAPSEIFEIVNVSINLFAVKKSVLTNFMSLVLF